LEEEQDAKKSMILEVLAAVTTMFSFVCCMMLDHQIIGSRSFEEPQDLHTQGFKCPRRHFRAVDPKMSSASPKGSATGFQGIHGNISAMAALKFKGFVENNRETGLIVNLLVSYGRWNRTIKHPVPITSDS
jgi:hypothetical protein